MPQVQVAGCRSPNALAQLCLLTPDLSFLLPATLQEWLHYVDKEKEARLAVEARVAQLAEDAAGLREWAVMQARPAACRRLEGGQT